jgi:DNA ligase-1
VKPHPQTWEAVTHESLRRPPRPPRPHPSRNGKLKLLTDYFRDTPDPDRGYGLAAIAGTLDIRNVKPAMLRELVLERIDEVLFRYSYDYVGDLAETISLVWDNERDIERSALPSRGSAR